MVKKCEKGDKRVKKGCEKRSAKMGWKRREWKKEWKKGVRREGKKGVGNNGWERKEG